MPPGKQRAGGYVYIIYMYIYIYIAVEALGLIDRDERRAAIKEGHTQPIAVGSARTAAGKKIGHVSR